MIRALLRFSQTSGYCGSNATQTSADRIERAGDAFHARLRKGFLEMAAREPARIVKIDASGTPDEVEERIWKSLTPMI